MLRRRCLAIAWVVAVAATVWPAYADQDASKIWFLSLSSAMRSELQADLVLVGDYDALVDGNFGASTFSGLQAYQRSIDDPATGVLSPKELAALQAEAASVYGAFGLQKTEDASAGLEISIPTKLLSRRSASENGTTYQSAGDALELETQRIFAPDPDAFGALFAERTTAGPLRTVSYAHLGPSSFTVTGSSDGRYFYDRFYRDGAGAAGFTLTWDMTAAKRGTMLAAYLASFSSPLANKPIEHGSASGSQPLPTPLTTSNSVPAPSDNETDVPLQPQGGIYVVPGLINNALTLNFMVDSGASDVSIPADVVLTLIRAGTITQNDFTGSQTYTTADGRQLPSQTFRLRSLAVGNKVVENVDALVAPVQGDLLLGQSFLSRFSSWSMDNGRHVLVLGDLNDNAGAGEPDSAGATVGAPVAAPTIGTPESRSAPVASLPPQPPAPRLALYGGLDFYGNDIFKGRVVDAVHCAAACLGDSQCRAFTFNANPAIHTGPNCFLKSGVNRLEAYSTAIGGLFLQPGESAPQYSFDAIDPTMDLLTNRDFPLGDLASYPYAPARTLDNCRMACIDNQQCEAFSYVNSRHQCWLKRIAGSSRFVRGVVSGTKHHVSIAAEEVINVPR